MSPKYPLEIQSFQILLEYESENRHHFWSELTLDNNELRTTFLDKKPDNY